MMKYKLITIMACLVTISTNQAHAIVRGVEIPKVGDKADYVSKLTKDYPLPSGVSSELYKGKLFLAGDANKSSKWEGYTQTEHDVNTEKTVDAVTMTSLALAAIGYGVYKKYEK